MLGHEQLLNADSQSAKHWGKVRNISLNLSILPMLGSINSLSPCGKSGFPHDNISFNFHYENLKNKKNWLYFVSSGVKCIISIEYCAQLQTGGQ